ncbi:GlxA family transcriptional regulator [Marinobacterium sp. D7]|uniref:GlxA family transcriptional regulator n=1 Tax=Marinobacterium ramblicola TaxID=2849041 RepID=UPI001C2DC084|nr:GlxA family transcriptional regulator [Marinobacterium ramblicola]MBV1788251.1 GlxA family transcriptional regulator [Marinobacterium ramblicola]
MSFHYPGAFDEEMELAEDASPDLNVGFLLVQDFTLMPVAGFVESLRFAADRSFRSQQLYCRWDWMSEGKQPVKASCGLEIKPQHDLGNPAQYDYIAVAGGLLDAATSPSEAILDYLRKAHEMDIPLIGLCSGSFVLAEAGLLDNHKCAVHFTVWEYFKKRYPGVQAVVDSGHIRDGNIITCPGGTAIDLAAEVIAAHCGRSRAQKGLDYLLVSPPSKGAAEEDSAEKPFDVARYENRLLESAIMLMQENLSTPYSIKNLAEQLDTTERQLTRLFSTFLHSAPANYWRKLRLEHSRLLLLNTTKKVTEIAYETGFADASHFSQWYRKRYGETPAEFRKRRTSIDA